MQITIKPRIRTFGEKTKRSHIQDHSVQKEQARKAAIEKLQNEKATVASFIKDKKIVFSDLPVISEHTRNILLRWLSKALEREDGKAKTEDGKVYYISNPKEKNNCIVECEDGYFQMPAFRMQIATGATTTINQITGRMLDAVKLPVPDADTINQFADFVKQVDKSKVAVLKIF